MMQEEYPNSVIVVENHMADPLATGETTSRGNWYGVQGYPTVQIDGLYQAVGANVCEQQFNTYEAYYNVRMNNTDGMSPVDVYGTFEITGAASLELSATATFKLVDPVGPLTDVRATILAYEDDVYFCCGYGGVDTWEHTTRRILDETVTLNAAGDSVVVQKSFPLVGGENPSGWDWWNMKVIAYLQRTTGDREIFQTARLQWPNTTGADEPAVRPVTQLLYVRPNPFPSQTRIGFRIGAGGAPAELAVFDVNGRRVKTLRQGALDAGRHEASWSGLDAQGRVMAPGVYFLRFISGGATEVEKLIRIE
ncbi:MAG: T9SS type A sorting domain-containing protein [Candidatus Eisenbacteria bacterium]|nr:T9SS type A sorting domain-containing protein [Candidatus Eisenbacteria bacterium]